MSVERLQTVLQLSATGADQVIAEVNRIIQALHKASGPGGGATPYAGLPNEIRQAIAAQLPKATVPMQTLAGQQEAAEKTKALAARLYNEKKYELAAALSSGASEDKIAKLKTQAERLEISLLNATNRESSARQRLMNEFVKMLPAVQEQAAQERLGAQMARDYVAAKRAEARAAERAAREQEQARQSLDRQRTRAYATQYEQQITQAARNRLTYETEMAKIRQRELAQMKASATEAFSQLPSTAALPRAEIDALLRRPPRQAEDTDKVYRQRQILADAQNAAAIAHSRLAEAVRRAELGQGASQTALREAVLRATNAQDAAARGVIDAQRKLQIAIENEALVHAKNTRTSLREDFMTGFRGQRGATYGEQMGQAFKFSVFYGTAYKLLFGLTQLLQDTFTEGVAFQQGMTELAIATGRPKEELDAIAADLGASATRAGFAPSQGIEVGARSLGLYGVTEADQAVQDRVMKTSAQIVNQMAVGSKMQPADLQGNIAAISQALGMGAAGQFRIADLDAYMTHKFGIGQGGTLEAVAQSASVGKAAGFSDEELFAIAADMISRTGQTPSAVGGYMAQIFSRGGEGSLVDVAKKQGIDPTQNLSAIVTQLSELYKGASGPEQAEISAAFGRGKIQNAAVALLGDYSEVLMRSAKAQDEAAGQANKQFAMRMNDIGGQLAQLQGVIADFAGELSKTGLLDFVGAGMVAFRELLEAINGLLRIWNRLPNAVQDTIIGLGLLSVALRTSAAKSAFGTVGGAYTAARQASWAAAMGGVGAGRPVDTGTAVTGAARAGAAGFASAGRAALGLIHPIAWAIGGLLAVGALKNSADAMAAAQRDAAEALARPSASYGSTSSEFGAYASELQSLAQANREATPGWVNLLTGFQADNRNDAMARRLENEARRITTIANRLAAAEAVTPTAATSAFAGTTGTELTTGLSALEAGGYTAGEQLKALRDILFGTAEAAEAAASAFDVEQYAHEAAGGLLAAVSDTFAGKNVFGTLGDQKGGLFTDKESRGLLGQNVSDIQGLIEARLPAREIAARTQAGMRELGVESLADIDQATANQLAGIVAEGVASNVVEDLGPGYASLGPVIRKAMIRSFRRKFLADAAGIKDVTSGTAPLDREAQMIAAEAVESLSEGRLGGMAEVDTKGRVAELQNRINLLKRIQARGTEPVGVIVDKINAARREIAANQIAELERLRRIAQRNAKSKAEIAEIGKSFLERELRAAIRAGDADQLVGILELAGDTAIKMARQIIREALRVVRKAREVAAQLAGPGELGAGFEHGGPSGSSGASPYSEYGGESAATRRRRRRRQRELEKLDEATGFALSAQGDEDVFRTGSDSGNRLLEEAKKEKEARDRETAAERAAAAAAAAAVRSGSPIDAARAEIMAAEAALAKAKEGSVEYYNALGQLYAAQHALADAQAAIPVAQAAAAAARDGGAIAAARASINEAREAMRAARGDQAAYFAALGQLYSAQEQLAQATRDYRKNVRLLSIDMTNPLAMARADARAAARKLRQDIAAGKGPDVIAQDRVDARTAQSNVEATKFSQRLQAVQTAEELGRISHGKYINYLESEKRRLEGIKHRTFQQQQQLDEVDRLLKDSANQMDAQWNFGDIKLPTPYQMRRYIEQSVKGRDRRIEAMTESRAGTRADAVRSQAGGQTSVSELKQTFTFHINGADTAMVKRTIEKYVGGAGRTRTAQPRRR